MSHNYLFDLYAYIDDRLAAVSRVSEDDAAFAAGRSDALISLHGYLESHLHRKLPRRLRVRAATCAK